MLLRVIRSAVAYQLLDQSGQPIGTVAQPASDQVVGRGAGAVLLTRVVPRRQQPMPLVFRRVSGAFRTVPHLSRAEPAA